MSVTSLDASRGASGSSAASTLHADLRADLHMVAPAGVRRAGRGLSPAAPVALGVLAALAVSLLADRVVVAGVCAVAWGVLTGVQTALHPRHSAVSSHVRADLRAGAVLVLVLSLSGVTELVAVHDARWGIAAVAAALGATVAARLLQVRPAEERRAVLVGTQDDVDAYLAAARGTGVLVAGCHVLDVDTGRGGHQHGGSGQAALETVDAHVDAVGADIVLVLPGRETDAALVRRLTLALEHNPVTVAVVTPVSSVAPHRLRTTELGPHTVLEVGAVGASRLEVRAKAVIDRLGALALLVVVAPLLLVMVLAVRLDSTGPGLYMSTRVGKDGQRFRMFKMRTMFADAESMKQALLDDNESDGVLFKIRRDPRVTRVGYLLRRSSLDELPQLLNVLRGDMSMVGPRPALPSEVASYDDHARRRLVVKPGITGLWQVSGRSDLQWDESLRLDLYYADNWRLVDDFTIAARTVSAVTMARGAY
jgi:exopolysaccharide biosynthesis polyprenyl glycosylphosphotransferase